MKRERFKIKKKMTRFVTHNIHIKLICVFLSFLIFLYVRYDREDTREYISDIALRNIPKNLTIASSSVEKVSVIVKGFKDQLIGLPNTIQAYIDLENATIGTNNLQIYVDNNSMPNNKLRVIINPRNSRIVLEEGVYRTVNITPDIIGVSILAEAIQDIKVNPSKTVIYGPKSIVNSMDSIKTLGIDITDRINDYNIKSTLKLPPYIKTDLSSVDISVIFNKNIIKKEYRDIPVYVNMPDNESLILELKEPLIIESMIIEGSDYIINELSKNSITISLDLQDISEEGNYKNRIVTVGTPSQVRLVSISPPSFDIVVKEKEKDK